MRFISDPPKVVLTKAFTTPMKNVVATARTCYSNKIVNDDEITENQMDTISKSIYQAGHHTTFQHPHFQFSIEGVSRHCVWDFMHSHPFYNSEQASQRYVPVSKNSIVIPDLENEYNDIYKDAYNYMFESYEKLSKMLIPIVEYYFYKRFQKSDRMAKKHAQTIAKKAQEIARYVLPIGTKTNLYHTVSGLVVMRYYRACLGGELPSEQFLIAKMMVDEIIKHDPNYKSIIQEPVGIGSFNESDIESTYFGKTTIKNNFDGFLDGNVSRLFSYSMNPEMVLGNVVREALSNDLMSDEEAIDLVMNPSKNKLLGESLNLLTMDKLSKCLQQVVFTFKKKISHAADSQNQRHRMTQASRPYLLRSLSSIPNVIIPKIISQPITDCKKTESVRHFAVIKFHQAVEKSWYAFQRIYEHNKEASLYILPNATAIRLTETGDLSSLMHKYRMRLCYNAQEEIWEASKQEVDEIAKVAPNIAKYLLPPCTLRKMAGTAPICPEGPRYCGVRVWTMEREKYERTI
jgi:flavin-dependent thymidylate synthase